MKYGPNVITLLVRVHKMSFLKNVGTLFKKKQKFHTCTALSTLSCSTNYPADVHVRMQISHARGLDINRSLTCQLHEGPVN